MRTEALRSFPGDIGLSMLNWFVAGKKLLDVSRSCPSPVHFGDSPASDVPRRPSMKLATALWLAMWLTPAAGQNAAIDPTSQVMTFSYPMQSGFVTHLLPTTLLPQAMGAV